MIIHDVKQNSVEWQMLRLGIPTSSEFDKIVTPTGKLSASADRYMDWLLAGWLIGSPLENDETSWMARGHEMEPFAVQSYEFETGRDTKMVGFITTDNGMIGTSPDRLVGEDGILEIKSPAPQTHVGYMRNQKVDKTYFIQAQGQLLVSGRAWVDLQSYSPGLPTVIRRVERDEEFLAKLGDALDQFVEKLLSARELLSSTYGPFERKPAKQTRPVDVLDVSDEDLERIMAMNRETF